MRKVAVVLNAGSGAELHHNAPVEQVAELFHEHQVEADVKLAHGGEELIELARRAAESDHEIIIAGGGDGTISAVASEVIKTNKTLGVLPLGTLNHFSKDLQIPQNLEEAIKTIANGHVKEIDVGEVNGRIFLNNSSLGLYPRIV